MSNIDNLIKQIQSQGTTSKWTGGYGADAATKDMARILNGIGITDINQFGLIDKPYDAQVNPDGRGGFVDMQGKPVDPKTVTAEQISGESGTDTIYTTKTTTKAYGNKETGQEVPMTYSERQTGNAWGGTFEGSGNTGYRVDFTPDGKPVFYTTGASSSDVGQYMPIIQLALLASGAGGLLGNALLGTGASQVAAGALGGALLGGGTAALTGQDILKGALMGGAGGALAGYLNPATGEILSSPTEGSIPVTGDDIVKLTGSSNNLGIDYSLANPNATNALEGLKAGTAANLSEMGGGQGLTFNVGPQVTSVADAIKAITTMNGSVNPANLSEMGGGQGLTYQTPTGLVTECGVLNVGGLTGNNSVISQGGIDTASNIGTDIAKRVAELKNGVENIKPIAPTEATTKSPLSVSDAIRLAGIAATVAGASKLAGTGNTSTSGYPIVPIPSEWTSPIKPTGTGEFTPLAPIDFGNKEMLRGTQWEKLLSPDYGKALPITQYTKPNNISFDELTKILGGSRESIPTQSLTINDVISGIQNQYGQAPNSAMG